MKILITNDDGIGNVGIKLLAAWAKKLGEVTVVAPKVEQSAKSHAIDFTRPIEVKKVDLLEGVRAYSMDSTPADCVRFAILGLKEKFDLVLSGINKGVNLGGDIVYSGTVGAVFEAARLGAKGIAFSSFPDDQVGASKHFDEVYDYIANNGMFEENGIFNVNIPKEVKGIRMTYQGSVYFSDAFELTEGSEEIYVQVGAPVPDEYPDDLDRDTVAILEGYITVTPLMATRTNMETFHKFKKLN